MSRAARRRDNVTPRYGVVSRRARASLAAPVAALGVCLLVSGCQPPVRDSLDYRRSAARSVGDAASELATVSFAVDLARRGDATSTYLRVLVGAAEDSLHSIDDAFAGLQPPTQADDAQRQRVLALLSTATTHAQDARVGIWLGRSLPDDETDRLASLQQQLDDAAAALSSGGDVRESSG